MENIFLLLMVLLRLSCFFVTTPFFSIPTIPSAVKLGVVGILTLLTYGMPIHQIALGDSLGNDWMTIAVIECLIGLMLGSTTTLMFMTIQSAGDLVDTVAGIKMSATYDPVTGSQSSLYSNLYNWIGLLLLLGMEGHHYLIKGIANSFRYLPIGSLKDFQFNLVEIVDLFRTYWMVTLQLAIPVAVLLFLIDVLLGVISKAIPQINVFILGMPVKLVVSFYVFMMIANGVLQAMKGSISLVFEELNSLIQTLF